VLLQGVIKRGVMFAALMAEFIKIALDLFTKGDKVRCMFVRGCTDIKRICFLIPFLLEICPKMVSKMGRELLKQWS
jgi:hypothetical protein